MSTLVVYVVVLCVLLSTTVRCNRATFKKDPSYRKETSTTFLRLTALRSDEGIWTARFGEYEISIELKHHPKFVERLDSEDTWTLKIKHTSKRFKATKIKDLDPYNNEVLMNALSSQIAAERESWRTIFDNLDNEAEEEDDGPVFKKVRTSGKAKRAKSRRQLPAKPLEVTHENNTKLRPDVDRDQTALQELPIFKELVQGDRHLDVAFDRIANESTNTSKDESFQEIDEKPWSNVAAIIFNSYPKENISREEERVQPIAQEDFNKMESTTTEETERLMDAYALPLQQFTEEDLQEDKVSVPQDVETVQETVTEKDNITPTSTQLDGMSSEDYEERNSESSTTTTEEPHVEKKDDITSDYVIEDITVREHDTEDEDDDVDDEGRNDSNEDDFEPTSEMKRILDWFPRSKLLTTENNGYKFFPGVGWFKLVTWPDRWSNARNICESEYAHLAVPDTKEKITIFLQIFKNYPDVLERTILNNQVYVGVYRSGQDRNFSTVLNKPFLPEIPIWFPNEPDNADPGEDCVTFHAEGKIRDVPCFYNLPFLCEKEPDIS